MAMLHERDLAAVAVEALTSEGHDGARYELTGPETLTRAEQVRTIGQAVGRPLRRQELSRAEERRRLLADDGFPDDFVDPCSTATPGCWTARRRSSPRPWRR
ncbi:hypothetical protein [Nonomuraea sp. NPDC052265]|uniref:hypothetical protein n=1 Tax=Nonomuraea sp. NPDC052265 TaxID=3364374 RepID=UPI0037C53C78